eukprot:m.348879 g.348879  ORF g.348879 m.348879 type:complete len:78 (-) comp39432_c0_seq1:163-396(-)
MHIYFSGMGGVGIGPLANLAHELGYDINGSDMRESKLTKKFLDIGIKVGINSTHEHIARSQLIGMFILQLSNQTIQS